VSNTLSANLVNFTYHSCGGINISEPNTISNFTAPQFGDTYSSTYSFDPFIDLTDGCYTPSEYFLEFQSGTNITADAFNKFIGFQPKCV
jgi:hypothetical protein